MTLRTHLIKYGLTVKQYADSVNAKDELSKAFQEATQAIEKDILELIESVPKLHLDRGDRTQNYVESDELRLKLKEYCK